MAVTKTKFTVQINTDNAAFSVDTNQEVARILTELASQVDFEVAQYKQGEPAQIIRLKDANGARVGFASFETYEEK